MIGIYLAYLVFLGGSTDNFIEFLFMFIVNFIFKVYPIYILHKLLVSGISFSFGYTFYMYFTAGDLKCSRLAKVSYPFLFMLHICCKYIVVCSSSTEPFVGLNRSL